MCARTMQDIWVVGRRSDQREFYVIINKKDTSLVDMGGALPNAGVRSRSALTASVTLQPRSRSFAPLSLPTFSWTNFAFYKVYISHHKCIKQGPLCGQEQEKNQGYVGRKKKQNQNLSALLDEAGRRRSLHRHVLFHHDVPNVVGKFWHVFALQAGCRNGGKHLKVGRTKVKKLRERGLLVHKALFCVPLTRMGPPVKILRWLS